MTAVLSSSEDGAYFGSSSLRRSESQSIFAASRPPRFPTGSDMGSQSPFSNFYSHPDPEADLSSSPPALQAESTDASFASTPTSDPSISDFDDALPLDCDDLPEDETFSLPILSQDKFFSRSPLSQDGSSEPPPSPKTRDSSDASPDEASEVESSSVVSVPDSPHSVERAQDDSAVVIKPSRHVDYLSHEWKEEDIWSSWRYIVSKRHHIGDSLRLENASWRTWGKAMNGLGTISADRLNWMKDCDVTWLYGLLQPGSCCLFPARTDSCSELLSKPGSLVNLDRKPILKKRSLSEIMLQRSLTTSSLLKQAMAAVYAQETRASLDSAMMGSTTDCYLTLPLSIRRPSAATNSSVTESTESSGVSSPSTERKHIHFNEQVEQCIAVEVKGDDDDDDDRHAATLTADDVESDSELMLEMARCRKKHAAPLRRRKSKAASSESKTIAMLPSTTLKYREDDPQGLDSPSGYTLSPSSSQETLRPVKQASAFYFGEEEDWDVAADDDDDSSWYAAPFERATAGLARPSSSASVATSSSSSSNGSSQANSGMRRTSSGMLMPCGDGESSTGEGILGRVIETVNTARDIAHVIWNVGWQK